MSAYLITAVSQIGIVGKVIFIAFVVFNGSDTFDFGLMYHGMTYADEAYSADTHGKMTANFWYPVMKKGIITFPKPQDCPLHKTIGGMEMKPFGETDNNFIGVKEFGEAE